MKQPLYNTYELYRSKNEKTSGRICDFIRSKLSDFTVNEDMNLQYEQVIDGAQEKLELLGFDFKQITFDNYYNVKPNIEVELSPYDFLDKDRFLNGKKREFEHKIEKYTKNYATSYPDANLEKYKENLQLSFKEYLEKMQTVSIPCLQIEDEDLIKAFAYIDAVYENLECEWKLNLFQKAENELFELEISADTTVYEALTFLFKFSTDTDDIQKFELDLIINKEEIELSDSDQWFVWDKLDEEIKSMASIVNDIYGDKVHEIYTEIKNSLEEVEEYIYSDEYIKDIIDSDEDEYSNYLFTEDGEFICELNDMEEISDNLYENEKYIHSVPKNE